MNYGYRQPTDNERYLQAELDQIKERQERQYQEQQEAKQQRVREMRKAGELSLRSADSWPEALRKQINLFKREADEYDTDRYFTDGAEAYERALVIWREVKAGRLAEIKALEEQIEAIWVSIREAVSARLDSEGNGRRGWHSAAWSLVETDDPGRFLDW